MSVVKLKNYILFSNFNNYKLLDILQYILLVQIQNLNAGINLAGSLERCRTVLRTFVQRDASKGKLDD